LINASHFSSSPAEKSIPSYSEANRRLADLRRALEISDSATTRRDLAVTLLEMGHGDEAILHLRKAVDLAPGVSGLHLTLGQALEESGQPEAALVEYRGVLSLDPSNLEGALSLARLHGHERPRIPEHRNEAIESLVKALSYVPKGPDAPSTSRTADLEAHAWFLLGSLYDDEAEHYLQAIEAYKTGLEFDPGCAVAHNNLGALYLHQGDHSLALTHLEQALHANPGLRNAHRNLAKLLYHRLTLKEGTDLFDRIARKGGASAGSSLFQLTQALINLASLEAYEDLYSRGHQIKNRVGMEASRLKRLARSVRSGEVERENLALRLEEVVTEQEALYGLLVEILRVVRPEHLKPVSTPVKTWLSRLGGRLRAGFKGRARIHIKIQSHLPPVRLDTTRMADAVTNLLKNAVEAVSERFGESAGTDGIILLSALLAPGRRELLLRVFDNGAGIPPTSLQEGCRAGYTTKPGGSGLGLAVTRRIVADHGGVLEMETPQDRGACFTIRLPLDVEVRESPTGLRARPIVLSEPDALMVDELA